jgi:hypothetical protein
MLRRVMELEEMRERLDRAVVAAPGPQHVVRVSEVVESVWQGVVSPRVVQDVVRLAEERGWQVVRVGGRRMFRGVRWSHETVSASLRRSRELRRACRR